MKDELKAKIQEIIKKAKDAGNEEIEVLGNEALALTTPPPDEPPGNEDPPD